MCAVTEDGGTLAEVGDVAGAISTYHCGGLQRECVCIEGIPWSDIGNVGSAAVKGGFIQNDDEARAKIEVEVKEVVSDVKGLAVEDHTRVIGPVGGAVNGLCIVDAIKEPIGGSTGPGV